MLSNSKDKSFLFNFIDTPGHPNFDDEVACALRKSDGVLLVIDVVEGLSSNFEQTLKEIVRQKLQIVLVINKLDRLVLELRVPPSDAYLKIRNVLE